MFCIRSMYDNKLRMQNIYIDTELAQTISTTHTINNYQRKMWILVWIITVVCA
jgi:hypothetical protein